MAPQTAFIIGATGFVGGHLVELLARKHPETRLTCLVRDVTPEKGDSLEKLNSNVKIVEGTLDDGDLICAQAEKVDIVIHVAHSDHAESVQAVLEGLTRRARSTPQRAPIYLHMSGLGIIADNVYGKQVEHPKEWTDVGFSLDE